MKMKKMMSKKTFVTEMAEQMKLYKLLRNCNVMVIRNQYLLLQQRNLPPNFREDVQRLKVFTTTEIDGMVTEWPKYVRLCEDLDEIEEAPAQSEHCQEAFKQRFIKIMDRSKVFWDINKSKLPNLSQLAMYAFTIPTSSASCERVFSILKRFFAKQQLRSALEDMTTSAVMLRYNNFARLHELTE